jgi:hypothetical protein
MVSTLARWIPNLAELDAEPRATLACGDLRIPRLRVNPLVPTLFVLAAVVPLFTVAYVRFEFSLWMLAGMAGLFIAAGAAALCHPFGTEVVLASKGVSFRRGGSEVFCPWALFNVSGNLFVQSSERLTLPVNAAAIPYIEQRQHGAVIAHGAEIHSPLLRLHEGRQVGIPWGFHANPTQLGELLLHLGRALCDPLPQSSVPPSAVPAIESSCRARTLPGGWIRLSLTRWRLPCVCCDCGQHSYGWTWWETGVSLPSFWEGLAQPSGGRVRVSVPLCEPCRKAFRTKWWLGGLLGAALGVAIVVPIADAISPKPQPPSQANPLIVGAFIGGMAGLCGGWLLVGTLLAPVRVARYSPAKRTVAVRFRNTRYANLVAASAE